jgi:thioredoxin-like negative regulator of GroEL
MPEIRPVVSPSVSVAASAASSFGGAGPLQLIKASEFQSKVLGGQGPIAVEFFSYTCPHCQRMQPILKEAAKQLAGKVSVLQVSVNDPAGSQLAASLGVNGVPTFMMYENGKLLASSGAPPQVDVVRRTILAAFPKA